MSGTIVRCRAIPILIVAILLCFFRIASGAQIEIAWDANTEPDLAGYKIYYGTASGAYGPPINVGNVTTCTLTGLTQGTIYFIAVTAVDTATNESGYSNEVSGAATDPLHNCTVATNPPGLQVVVDGTTYSSPQTFSWVVGSSHTLSVVSPQSGSPGTRYVYSSWSDGGGQSHTITGPSSSTTYTAMFGTQYNLTTSIGASGGGSVSPSGTNWYPSGQAVSVSATANTGYSFGSWSGDLSGSTSPSSVAMSGPKSVTANFTQNQYTVAVNTNPSGSGLVAKSPDKATYVYGDVVTLTAAANTGYLFSNWSGNVTGSTNPYNLTINNNKSVTANFVMAGALSVTPAGGLMTSGYQGGPFSPGGQAYTLKNTGGNSINWSASKTQGWVSLSSSSGTLGGGASATVTVSINAGANSLTAGVYTDTVTFSNVTNGVGNTSRSVALTVNASIQSHTVATNPPGLQVVVDGTTYSSPQAFSWVVGSSHTVSVVSPQSGSPGTRYVYSSWSDGGGQSHTMTAPSSGTTYTATFGTQYNLTTSVGASGGGSVSPSGTNWYSSGQAVSVSATANTGYSLGSWSGDLSGSTSPSIVTMSGPKSVTANFTQNQYTVAVNTTPSGSGSVAKSPDKATYVYGDVVTLTAAANTGYLFSNWSRSVTGSTNPYNLTINDNKSVTANFTQNQYTVAVNTTPSGSGSVAKSPDKATYVYGDVVTLTATANTGYLFSNWSGNATGSTNPYNLTINDNKSVTANFTQNQYTVAVNTTPSGSGSVAKSPDKATYVYGDVVTLTATANTGYLFSSWSGDGSGAKNPYTLMIDGNKSITANLTHVPETISTPNSPTGRTKGVVGTAYAYSSGGSVSGQGHPVEYQFDWKGDGSDLSPWGPATQTKSWSVPGDYMVRVRARCATDTDVLSSWSTSLRDHVKGVPSIRLASPIGGEVFKVGSTQKLSWMSENLDPSGKISLSYFDNSEWVEIAELPSGSTSYYWTVPNTPLPTALMRIGNRVEGDWECQDATKGYFTIASNVGTFAEGGWIFDLLNTDNGGAAIWFQDNKLVGYGLSLTSGMFGIEGTYEVGSKGTLSGNYQLYDFDFVTEFETGSFTAKAGGKGTNLTMALQPSGVELPPLTLKGSLLLSDPPIPQEWVIGITGGREGSLDSLRIEPYQVDNQVYPRLFRVAGSGSISGAGPIEMAGYLILTSKKIAYGNYEMSGAVSETGVLSGKLDPVSGKLKLKAMSDDGVSHTQSGIVKP